MIYPDAIPAELKAYDQWVCWKFEETDGDKPTKVLYNVATGHHASTNKPASWVSFERALHAAPNYDGIGFVLTETDPFVFIDLDNYADDPDPVACLNRQKLIVETFDSYTERSPSGKGVHVLVKGAVPSGRKRSKIEIYSSGRFMTVTGDAYKPLPIIERDELANKLWSQMGGPAAIYSVNGDAPQTEPDEVILERAANASNGELFKTLAYGDWRDEYNSQSEADISFINIIAFYTQNRDQIIRIFRASKLGEREKAKRNDYVAWMVNKSFDNILPPIDIDGLRINIETKMLTAAQTANDSDVAEAPHHYKAGPEYRVPPGLMGQIANYIHSQAARPVPEIAIAGAIGLMSGICGRAYNISNTGLNHYTLLIANTGTGKEAMATGIDALIEAVRATVPSVDEFVGPAEIASPQALIRYLSEQSPCFLSVVGEYGLQMQQMSMGNGNPVAIGLKRAFLNLYAKSGQGQRFHETVYSDKKNNVSSIISPNFSILAEAEPNGFYGALDEESVSSGLLPRFTLIEYHGPRVEFVEANMGRLPPDNLVTRLATLASTCLQLGQQSKTVDVGIDLEAKKWLDEYGRFCDKQINGSAKDVVKQLWNRAHLRVLKLAALVAVGIHPFSPVITMECIDWAGPIITNNVMRLLARFERGEVGNGKTGINGGASETAQVQEVCAIINKYYKDAKKAVETYKVPAKMYNDKVIPLQYLQRATGCLTLFKSDKRGATDALKRTLQTLLDTDILREVDKKTLGDKYGTRARSFILADVTILAP